MHRTLAVFFICQAVSIYGSLLPSGFQTCKRNDRSLNDCLKSAVQAALPLLAKGLPEFNIKGIEPIKVRSLTIGEGSRIVNVVQNYRNVEIHHVSLSKVERVESVITNNVFRMAIDTTIDNVHFNARYNLNGSILNSPIAGEGDSKLLLWYPKIKWELIGKIIEKEGEEYVEIRTFRVVLNPEKVEIDFKNLYNGDRTLARQMHKLLNENAMEIFSDVKAQYEETLGGIFKKLANQILSKIPFNEMFGEW